MKVKYSPDLSHRSHHRTQRSLQENTYEKDRIVIRIYDAGSITGCNYETFTRPFAGRR